MTHIRPTKLTRLFCTFLCALLIATTSFAQDSDKPTTPQWVKDYQAHLDQGKWEEALDVAMLQIVSEDNNTSGKFCAGFARLVGTMEWTMQQLSQYPLARQEFNPLRMMGIRLPQIPRSKKTYAEPLTYEETRVFFQSIHRRLGKVSELMSEVEGDFKVPIHLGRIRIDMNGDGIRSEKESFATAFAILTRIPLDQERASDFYVAFDQADAVWLEGYCHLVSAICDFGLAHDYRDLFERCSHLLIEKVESPYPYLTHRQRGHNEMFFLDAIAAIHSVNFEVIDEESLFGIKEHLLSAIICSRKNWELINAETDNDHELLPSPKQQSVVGWVEINDSRIEAWHTFLDEMEMILEGKRLAPFWRDPNRTLGINISKYFEEPCTFDLVTIIQGSALDQYLEEGDIVRRGFMRDLQRAFNGGFWSHAAMIN
ncbi:hypothetical protein JD969_08100 [Planctomycetota bacterium]|nr:hypothetical protein JD969_08100 [Planctomycetota bacterium]